MREKDPFRLELMEYYSTALWHLQVKAPKHFIELDQVADCKQIVTFNNYQEEVQLSALAQDLQRLNKSSAAAW